LGATDPLSISVVISTFERPDACERALVSVLAQADQTLEILICDDGSRDETPLRFREWEKRCEKVRYLRNATNTGTPATARNLGVACARGSWIAFLDDDDEWLPDKLNRQRTAISEQVADVIASNALRSGGSLYFPEAPSVFRPTREDLLKLNPVITSSTVVRRSLAGFPTAAWMAGVEDYAAWLALADRGARFLILGEPLISYEDSAPDRLSSARAHREIAVARLAWQRLLQDPFEASKASAAARRTVGAAYVIASDTLAAARARTRS
jgi:glycosyltransferase involved in cell wall biosynthesis